MADGDEVADASGDPVADASGDPLAYPCCCGGSACVCCEEYDITFLGGESAPFGGNTFRVARVIVADCAIDSGSEWQYDDGLGTTVRMFYLAPSWRVSARVAGVEFSGATFLHCEETSPYPTPCCPQFDSQTMLGGSGVDTVVCVDVGGE